MNHSVLIITTSHGVLGDTGKPTGLYWEELATPYWLFKDHGMDVQLASIMGGRPPVDPQSERSDESPDVRRFLDDIGAMQGLDLTAAIDDIDPAAYQMIFLPGGHGTMWDLPDNPALGALLAAAYAGGAVIGAVCHGPAGLIGVNDADGEPLVAGRTISAFTDDEERAAGLDGVVPFLLESRLRELGAIFTRSEENWAPHAVRDGRLVTGQNPASSQRVANLMIEALEEGALADVPPPPTRYGRP